MRVLGIETSCDETAVAIICENSGLLANQIYSQVSLHGDYGGVVPELASRDHIRKLAPLIQHALTEAQLSLAKDIDAIAYTSGPGLMGALLVGAGLARSLAWAAGKPAIAVHHMEAHLLSPMLENVVPDYPYLALLVSGGHTLLVEVLAIGNYRVLGETLDDAVGEAFDKVAKMLGLGYPGGPAIAQCATRGNTDTFVFPRPMIDRPDLNFSFSGLKTHVFNTLREITQGELTNIDDQIRADIARAFEDAIVDTLCIKVAQAIKQTRANSLVVAGGVGANKKLRKQLKQRLTNKSVQVFYPKPEYCTDNAAMIAQLGLLRMQSDRYEPLHIKVQPRWSLENI